MFVGSTTSSVVACNFAVSSFQPKVTWPEHRPAGSARHSGITHDAGSQASEAPIEPSWGPEPQMAGAVKSEPGVPLRKKPVVVSQLPWKPTSTKTQPVPDPAGGRGSMPQVRSLKKILVKRTPWRHCHSHAEMAWTIYVSRWYWQSRFYAPSTSGSRRPPRRMDALRAPQRLVRPPEGADQP